MKSAAWKAVLACLVIGLALSSASPVGREALEAWESFVQTYGKNYPTEQEYQQRKAIFMENYQKIQVQNEKFQSAESTYEAGVNQFSDLSTEEFLKGFTGALELDSLPEAGPVEQSPVGAASDWDWRTKGFVPAVKNQGNCGSCWAFATQATLETAYNIKKGSKVANFSEQQLVDCDTQSFGCSGGYPHTALAYLKSKGIASSSAYSYKAAKGTCQSSLANLALNTFTYNTNMLYNYNDAVMQDTINLKGPVIVFIDATPLQTYKNGIISISNCTYYNHAVNVVGYAKTNQATPYYILRNSWGATWGESGYFRVAIANSCILKRYGWWATY